MSDNSTITIEINGRPVQARKGAMVIEVADEIGVRIPRFCYHKKLSVAANCRMCLVEVEKAPKPLPACATPVMDGMKVYTHSPKAISAQKATMEFLLINHPLDCPICDQGGECELQDVAMGYGGDVSRFNEGKRVVPDKNIGPLISTDMTRCIHCTRCVRFGEELAGIRELGATGRGENTRIGTYIANTVNSEMSGNVIDLCPVGALNAKPSRYSARAWELRQFEGIAAHDCIGSNLYFHSFRGSVTRVVPRDNEEINECWLSDRDRFSYQGINNQERLQLPMIKNGESWEECSWDEALQLAAKGIQQVCRKTSPHQLGIMVSPNASTEEMYLLHRIAHQIGCPNIDHRLRQADFQGQENAPLFPWLGQSIADIESVDSLLLIGSNIRKEQPIAAHRLRKATMRGANVSVLNCRDFDFNFRLKQKIIVSPDQMLEELAAIAKLVCDQSSLQQLGPLSALIMDSTPDDKHRQIADQLKQAENALVLLGSQAPAFNNYSVIHALAIAIAQSAGVRFGYLSDGANASGACLAGVLPHRDAGGKAVDEVGLDARAMLETPRQAYLLYGVEPEFDCWDPSAARSALHSSKLVIAITPYVTEELKQTANVLLPLALPAESSGTYVNVAGNWQSFAGACKPQGESRPGWKILRVLGNLLDLENFEYTSSEQIRDELKEQLADIDYSNVVNSFSVVDIPEPSSAVMRISGVSIYGSDMQVRRAEALQQTADAQDTALRISSKLAKGLGLHHAARVVVTQGQSRASLNMIIDDSVPEACVWIPVGTNESSNLGPMFGPISLEAE